MAPKLYPSPKPSSERHAETPESQSGRQGEDERMIMGGRGVSGAPCHSSSEPKLSDSTLENKGWMGGVETIRSVSSCPSPPSTSSFLFLFTFTQWEPFKARQLVKKKPSWWCTAQDVRWWWSTFIYKDQRQIKRVQKRKTHTHTLWYVCTFCFFNNSNWEVQISHS